MFIYELSPKALMLISTAFSLFIGFRHMLFMKQLTAVFLLISFQVRAGFAPQACSKPNDIGVSPFTNEQSVSNLAIDSKKLKNRELLNENIQKNNFNYYTKTSQSNYSIQNFWVISLNPKINSDSSKILMRLNAKPRKEEAYNQFNYLFMIFVCIIIGIISKFIFKKDCFNTLFFLNLPGFLIISRSFYEQLILLQNDPEARGLDWMVLANSGLISLSYFIYKFEIADMHQSRFAGKMICQLYLLIIVPILWLVLIHFDPNRINWSILFGNLLRFSWLAKVILEDILLNVISRWKKK
jgi:hypothetical protein